MDFSRAVPIAEHIYWIGSRLPDDPFQCHAYLIENGDESILIDPGSMLEFDAVVEKMSDVVDPSQVRYIVLHHQDPDLAASLPQMEALINREDLLLVTHSRMKPLIKHYGVRSGYYEIDRHDLKLQTRSGLGLEFVTTPYCHSPGAFVTYEPRSGVLFSGDIFGGMEESWRFYADENYFEYVREFHSSYMPGRDILNYALRKIEKLEPSLIAPQHGSIVRKDLIPGLIERMKTLECGLYIEKKYHQELTDSIEKLKHQEKELNTYKNHLEEKVREKTHSLQEANRQLEEERERLARFNRYVSELHSVDIGYLANTATRHLLEMADAQLAIFFVPKEEGLEAIAKSAVDRALLNDSSLSALSEEIARRSYDRKERVTFDLTGEGEPFGTPEIQQTPLRHIRSIPLRFQERDLGVLLLASVSPPHSNEGYMEGYIATLVQSLNNAFTFIAMQKQSLELQRINEALEMSNRHKSEFLANVSHELRTPLNSIIGFSNILLKNNTGNLEERQLQRLEKIRRNGIHLLDLINAILDLSKIEAGKMEVEMRTVELIGCLEELVTMFLPQATEGFKRLKFQNMTGKEKLFVRTDAQKCRQILINLISNALKFVEEGSGEVEVRVTEKGSEVEIAVIDNGIGIRPEDLSVIFDAFRQADGSPTRRYGGTGLGLTICRNLTRLIGAFLDVESQPGEGSVFRLRLPVESPKGAEKERTTRTIESKVSRFGPLEKVLIIDDNPDTVELLSEYFTEIGCKTKGVTDPEEGVHLAKKWHPSLVTLDIMMPGISGWDVLNRLKRNPSTEEIPVLLISNLSEQERASRLGAVDTLVKPFSKEELEALVKKHFPKESSLPHALVIDEEKRRRDLLVESLRPRLGRIVEASSGKEALRLLQEGFVPDIVYLDLRMSEMGGVEFLEACKSKGWLLHAKLIVVAAADPSAEEKKIWMENEALVLPEGSGVEAIAKEFGRWADGDL